MNCSRPFRALRSADAAVWVISLGLMPAFMPARLLSQVQAHTVQIANQSGEALTAVVVSSGPNAWSENRLPSSPLAPDGTAAISFSGPAGLCFFNLKATLASGKSLTSTQFNACAGAPWIVRHELPMMAKLPGVLLQPPTPVPHAAPAHPGPPAGNGKGEPIPAPHGHAGVPEDEQSAYLHAPVGAASYEVARQMDVGTSYPATATLYSPGAASVPAGAHALRMSSFMIVTLTAPDSPGAFIIDATQQATCQFIPEGGMTQWHFRVTPQSTGAERLFALHGSQTLAFTAYMVYGTDAASACSPANSLRRQLLVDHETVEVKAFGSLWERALDYIANNPGTALLFVLGGGAGIPGLVKLLTMAWQWLRRRIAARQTNGGGAARAGS